MRLLQFKKEQETRLGICTDKGVLDVKALNNLFALNAPLTMDELIIKGEEGIYTLKELLLQSTSNGISSLFLRDEDLQILPIVKKPEKIICVGLNYLPHIKEANMDIPQSPVLFSKFNNSLASHNEKIKLPPTAEKYDYEAELVLVIGKEAHNVDKQEALSYVFGYSVGNDFSARDLQMRTGQWLLGKTLDQFAPVGPYLVTADEINQSDLDISCKVNGEVRQSANTKDMLFDCASLISYISQYMTLKPGDIIFTGTPEGVILGYSEENQKWLKPGDEVEVTISRLGTLRNILV